MFSFPLRDVGLGVGRGREEGDGGGELRFMECLWRKGRGWWSEVVGGAAAVRLQCYEGALLLLLGVPGEGLGRAWGGAAVSQLCGEQP